MTVFLKNMTAFLKKATAFKKKRGLFQSVIQSEAKNDIIIDYCVGKSNRCR